MVWCVTGKGRAASFTILVSFFNFFAPLGYDQGVLGFSGYCASAKDDKFLLSFNFDFLLPSCK